MIQCLNSLGLQHSDFELGNVRVQGRSFEGGSYCFAGVDGINNLVDPEAGGSIAGIGLLVITAFN